MEKLTGEDLRVAVSEEMSFAYEELGENPSLSALLKYMKSHLREANFASNTEELRNILLDYVGSDINESIYKQMDSIDDKESLNEKYNVRTIKDLKKLKESTLKQRGSLNESENGYTIEDAIEFAREYVLDSNSYNDYDVESDGDNLSVTIWVDDEYGDEVEKIFNMSINKLFELVYDEDAFASYIDNCEKSDNTEDVGEEFYRQAEEELNKHFNCTGAYLEPSTQLGQGRTFLFADNMEFEGSFDFQTGEEYIDDNNFEGFLELCKNSFRVKTVESLTDGSLDEASEKTLRSFASTVQRSLTDGNKAVVNKETQCVDIVDPLGNIIAQAYPRYKTVEKEYKALKRVTKDEIQDDDVIYVRRNKTGNKNVIDGIGTVKRVSGVYDSVEDALKS